VTQLLKETEERWLQVHAELEEIGEVRESWALRRERAPRFARTLGYLTMSCRQHWREAALVNKLFLCKGNTKIFQTFGSAILDGIPEC
jgi:hypothetical protein